MKLFHSQHLCLLCVSVSLWFNFVERIAAAAPAPSPWHAGIANAQPKIVKIFGAGGLRGLEAYQSGMLISATGHVLTVYSYVLDSETVSVVLDDGRRFEAKLLGADPRLEIAVLKFEAADLPHFNLTEAVEGVVGSRVLALSNLYGVANGDEQASVQHGVIAARTQLSGRLGVFASPYRGPIYVLDAMTNNPGAAGGAVTDIRGRLLGMIGKELRDSRSNLWLNYALPIEPLRAAVDDIQAGRSRPASPDEGRQARHPLDFAALGLLLVPNVVDSTPPFVESVRPGSPAAKGSIMVDDLILFVNDRLVQSRRDVRDVCRGTEAGSPVHLTVRRGQELKVLAIEPSMGEVTKP
ncbi:MAG: S1C family serine protease [Planctomycetes bacterium]|nr:S1C family serine protease [Planctomycetota bacterium]